MKTYEDGLNEAWEVVRRLYNEIGHDKRFELFGYCLPREIVNALTPQEIVERLKKHDAENRIVHVGDEIYSELTNCKAVVQRIDSWNRYQCFNDGGAQFVIGTETFNDYWVKTGKNYPQIAEVLKQMQEGNE